MDGCQVFFITNRRSRNRANAAFSHVIRAEDVGAKAYFGQADIVSAAQNGAEGGATDRIVHRRLHPATAGDPVDFAAARGRRIAGFFEAVVADAAARPGAQILLWVHGRAAGVETALAQAAVLWRRYRPNGDGGCGGPAPTVLAFLWPSGCREAMSAAAPGYCEDLDRAGRSGVALAGVLSGLARARAEYAARAGVSAPEAILAAHGLGATALQSALREGGAPSATAAEAEKPFSRALLMAPDCPRHGLAAGASLGTLLCWAGETLIYYSAQDHAISQAHTWCANASDRRLGVSGPPRALDPVDRRLTLVDCTDVAAAANEADAGHHYFLSQPEVGRHVRAVLSGQPRDAWAATGSRGATSWVLLEDPQA